MKRPKYVQELVNEVNELWRATGQKNEHCTLMIFMQSYLLQKKMYRGYNFYKVENHDGKDIAVLAGSADKDKYDFIQLW